MSFDTKYTCQPYPVPLYPPICGSEYMWHDTRVEVFDALAVQYRLWGDPRAHCKAYGRFVRGVYPCWWDDQEDVLNRIHLFVPIPDQVRYLASFYGPFGTTSRDSPNHTVLALLAERSPPNPFYRRPELSQEFYADRSERGLEKCEAHRARAAEKAAAARAQLIAELAWHARRPRPSCTGTQPEAAVSQNPDVAAPRRKHPDAAAPRRKHPDAAPARPQ